MCLIRNDLTTIWCELTSSIRTRTVNDEDSELGIIDHNPKAAVDALTDTPKQEEKELLLCFRPYIEGRKVGEELRFPRRNSKLNVADESEVATSCKKIAAQASTAASHLEVVSSDVKSENHRPPKKRTFVSEDIAANGDRPKRKHHRVKNNERQEDEENAVESLSDVGKK